MRAIGVLFALALATGCTDEPDALAEHQGTAVFFNFYDEPVQAYINNELLFSERLDVDDASTGLSKTIDVTLSGCSRLRVIASSGEAEEVCVERSGFGLWISPQPSGDLIVIELEENFTPALD